MLTVAVFHHFSPIFHLIFSGTLAGASEHMRTKGLVRDRARICAVAMAAAGNSAAMAAAENAAAGLLPTAVAAPASGVGPISILCKFSSKRHVSF